MKSIALLLLAVLGADANLLRTKTDEKPIVTRQLLKDDDRKALFKDDEEFWTRHLTEIETSIACVGDGGMLECPECCFEATCIPCIPVCLEDGGDVDCGEDCCENGACVDCPPDQCIGDGGDVDCSGNMDMQCCEDGACIPCPAPQCIGDGGDVDCTGNMEMQCCEDGACVPCPADPLVVAPPECVGDGGDVDCSGNMDMQCCEDGQCVPCPPVCPADGGDLDCSGNMDMQCCEDGACVPCVCLEEGGDLDCSGNMDENTCCENGACIPCPECILELSIDCPDCFGGNTTVANCQDRPLEITMFYAGGDCNMSRNCQDDKFECEDFNGGPPSGMGSRSWIVATDWGGSEVYFEGWVDTYSLYLMENNMERFPADQTIKVYASEDTEDPTQLLQSLTYHSSCSQNLDLLNRFGSQVIWGWYNEEQGNVTGATNSSFSVSVDIPIGAVQFAGEEDAIITGLYVAKTSTTTVGEVELPPEFFDLTDAVAGSTIGSGGTFVGADVAIPLNLAVEQDVTFLITMEAQTASGTDCTAIELLEFTAGGSPLDIGSTNECPEDW